VLSDLWSTASVGTAGASDPAARTFDFDALQIVVAVALTYRA